MKIGQFIRRLRWPEAALLAVCAFVVAKQLFLPGFIGLADGGDAPKIAARLQLWAVDNRDHGAYFVPLYHRGPRWNAHVPSCELLFAMASACLEQGIGDRATFDIRWAGALHAAVFLLCYWLLLLVLRPLAIPARLILGLIGIWIFADSGLVTYFNSFYMDAPALLGGLAVIMLGALLLMQTEPAPGLLIGFGAAGLLLATSKSAHAPAAIVLAVLAGAIAWRSPRSAVRGTGAAIGAVVLAGAIWMLSATPDDYKAQAQFNVIFYRLAKDRLPSDDLRELRLDDSFLQYAGFHSFLPNTPMSDPGWVRRFYSRTSTRDLIRFYLRHPIRTAGYLWTDLDRAAWMRRVPYMGNFTRASGMPPKSMAAEFGSWSLLTQRFYRAHPAFLCVWHGALLVGCPLLGLTLRLPYPRAIAWTLWGTSVLACVEYAVCSLGDTINTERHLIVFHLFTDATVLFVLVLFAALAALRLPPQPFRSPSSPPPR